MAAFVFPYITLIIGSANINNTTTARQPVMKVMRKDWCKRWATKPMLPLASASLTAGTSDVDSADIIKEGSI